MCMCHKTKKSSSGNGSSMQTWQQLNSEKGNKKPWSNTTGRAKNNHKKLDNYFTRLQLPEKVGHVSVWTVDSPKSWQQSHECHPNHTNTADELFYRQDSWGREKHGISNLALFTLLHTWCLPNTTQSCFIDLTAFPLQWPQVTGRTHRD